MRKDNWCWTLGFRHANSSGKRRGSRVMLMLRQVGINSKRPPPVGKNRTEGSHSKLLWTLEQCRHVKGKERRRERKSERLRKINKMMEGDAGSVSGLSWSRWLMLGEVGRVMQVQSRADSLHSHGWAASLLPGDCLSDYLSGITQADVTITTGSRLPINNHLRYTQQPQSHPVLLVLHPLSHVIARASNMSLINALWLLISYSHKPVKAAVSLRRSVMSKLDTGLIYAGRGNCCFCVYWCAYLHTCKLNSTFGSIDCFIFIHLTLPPNPTCPSSPLPHSYRCPVFIASSSQWSGATCLQLYPRSSPVQSARVGELSSMSSPLLWYANQQREKGSRVNKSFDFSMAHMTKINLLM